MGCDIASHEAIKADDTRWTVEVANKRVWPDDEEPLLIGECVHCQSTIARLAPLPPLVSQVRP